MNSFVEAFRCSSIRRTIASRWKAARPTQLASVERLITTPERARICESR
jgi:hypothetical protein